MLTLQVKEFLNTYCDLNVVDEDFDIEADQVLLVLAPEAHSVRADAVAIKIMTHLPDCFIIWVDEPFWIWFLPLETIKATEDEGYFTAPNTIDTLIIIAAIFGKIVERHYL